MEYLAKNAKPFLDNLLISLAKAKPDDAVTLFLNIFRSYL